MRRAHLFPGTEVRGRGGSAHAQRAQRAPEVGMDSEGPTSPPLLQGPIGALGTYRTCSAPQRPMRTYRTHQNLQNRYVDP